MGQFIDECNGGPPRQEGIEVREVQVTDDVASASKDEAARRRGIAGDIVVFKCAGAAAERGLSLAEVERVAIKANAATRSVCGKT